MGCTQQQHNLYTWVQLQTLPLPMHVEVACCIDPMPSHVVMQSTMSRGHIWVWVDSSFTVFTQSPMWLCINLHIIAHSKDTGIFPVSMHIDTAAPLLATTQQLQEAFTVCFTCSSHCLVLRGVCALCAL